MTTAAQALEALYVCSQTLRHFTRATSTLADTTARGQMHEALATLRQHIESTAAELEAMRKDAERYRWLRNQAQAAEWSQLAWSDDVEALDAAIDAALSAPPLNSGEGGE